ncbi:MAG: glycosyltransferase [Melioribacteraceae bacterium]|nr:glycosyltransferase [Melioribacteraceae bacterium]
MFEIIFLILLSVYFIFIATLIVGASKTFPKLKEEDLPTVSIIVAARNEEDNILDCIKSLDKLEYPEGKIEIILADDNSTDATGKIIDEFIAEKPKFKKIIPQKQKGELKGKTLAIANAIESVKNEIILTTDADCVVSPKWAKTIASYYIDDKVAIVNGMTNQFVIDNFSAMQSVDFILLLSAASGTINIGKPMSCIGNNMSYRKSAYDEVGGYENLKFSVTEDFRLLIAINNLKKYKIIYPVDKDALVTSKACKSVKELYHQKKRWSVGGLDSEPAGAVLISVSFLTNLMMFLSIIFFSKAIISLMAFKLIIDYFFIFPVHQKLGLKLKWIHFLLFELYYSLYVVMMPIILIFSRKVYWKEREFV